MKLLEKIVNYISQLFFTEIGENIIKWMLNHKFLNSQFISSMIGALLGAGVAVHVAKLQNKQQLKQLQDEHKLQREFLKNKKKTKESESFCNLQLNGLRGRMEY